MIEYCKCNVPMEYWGLPTGLYAMCPKCKAKFQIMPGDWTLNNG